MFCCSMRRNRVVDVLLVNRNVRSLHLHYHDAVNRWNLCAPVGRIPLVSATTVDEAHDAASKLLGAATSNDVAQLRAGVVLPQTEETAATWVGSERTDVQTVIQSAQAARDCAQEMLGNRVKSQSTGAEGRPCRSVSLVSRPRTIGPTYDILVFASRVFHRPAVKLSSLDPDGKRVPGSEGVFTLDINRDDVNVAELDTWLQECGMSDARHREQASLVIRGLWITWKRDDALRLSVHLGFSASCQPVLSDIRVLIDDFALHRQPELKALSDAEQVHPLQKQASDAGLFYNKNLARGSIGCFGYGAGVAMSTMDALVNAGGKPANFLDGGGGATPANVQAAMGVLLADPDVKAIFVNSFGGITKTDVIAQGIVDVLRKRKSQGLSVPKLVVRLRGTGEVEAKQILKEARDLDGTQVIEDMKEAAAAAVRAAAN